MNPHMGSQQQAHGGGVQQPGFFPIQGPQQHPNAGQQRQMPNAQQKGNHSQQQTRASYVDPIPQLSLWTFEKPSQSLTWDDVKPRKEYVSQEEIQEKLTKLKRKEETVTDCLDLTKSRSCRAEIRNFVEDQNAKLKKDNGLGEYIIAGMVLADYRQGRKDKQKYPHRVQVILQVEESSLMDTQNLKYATGSPGNTHMAQDLNKSMKAGIAQGQQQHGSMQNPGVSMGQQQRPVQQGQHHMGHGHHFEQRPPPPPNGQSQMHQMGNAPPPPPPPPPGHPGHTQGGGHPPSPPPPPHNGVHMNQHQHGRQQQPKMQMPGSYPGTPVNGVRHVQPGVRIVHEHKTNHKPHHGKSSDEEWDTETSSGSEPWRTRSISDDFAYVEDKRGRGHSKPSHQGKKVVHKSRSRVRSRSVSQHRRPPSRTRRESDSSDHRSHARATYNSSSDESRRGKKYWIRPSPTRAYNVRATGKYRPSSPSSDYSSHDSWTDATSSVYSNEHDRREHVDNRTRMNSRNRHSYRRPSIKRYDTVNRHNIREFSTANDYPHEPLPHRAHDAYPEGLGLGSSRPLPHRATTLPQMPSIHNAGVPVQGSMQSRSFAYDQQPRGYMADNAYLQQPQHYVPGNVSAAQDRYTLEELRLKLNQLKLEEQRALFGQDRDTIEEISMLRNQLNSAEQRVLLGQNRYTLEEFRAMYNGRDNTRQRAPLRRVQTDMDPALFYSNSDETDLRQRQNGQRRQGFLDTEFSDPRYASRMPYDQYRG